MNCISKIVFINPNVDSFLSLTTHTIHVQTVWDLLRLAFDSPIQFNRSCWNYHLLSSHDREERPKLTWNPFGLAISNWMWTAVLLIVEAIRRDLHGPAKELKWNWVYCHRQEFEVVRRVGVNKRVTADFSAVRLTVMSLTTNFRRMSNVGQV